MSEHRFQIDIPTTWCLGSTKNRKMIHRPGCRHARRPYTWAGEISERGLLDKLKGSGHSAVEANDACYYCTTYLHNELRRLRLLLGVAS